MDRMPRLSESERAFLDAKMREALAWDGSPLIQIFGVRTGQDAGGYYTSLPHSLLKERGHA